jgi:CheY-like chemotaxis protein/HPt (histidine-containing phosphotransfer) domain-containing protein
MGGTVSLKSRYGIGSIFTVNLLQGIVDETLIGPQLVKELQNFRFVSTWHPRRRFRTHEYMPYGTVLVVDDIRTNLDVLRGLLLPYALTVDYAGSGHEAVKKIRKNEPLYDLVFMDHMMPVMDGVETTRIIREEIDTDYARTVPIIALTANALAGSKAMFMSCGFNGFISKPIDLELLDNALNTWIRDKQSEATLQEAREQAKSKMSASRAEPRTEVIIADAYLDGIDLQENALRYENEKTYIKILQSYFRYTPPLLERIREIYNEKIVTQLPSGTLLIPRDILKDAGYLTDYASAVHGIKGSSYAIGADAVGRFAESMEFVAKSGNYELLNASHDIFVSLVESLLGNLQEFLSAYELNEANRAKPILPEPDPRLLKKILEASKRYRLEDMENALANLEKCSYESSEDLIVWLREQTDNLEYDLVRERLEQFL